MLVGLQDDAMTVYGNPSTAFPLLRQLRTQIIRVNLKEIQLGRAGRDIQLQDGDIINVPKAQTLYVTGAVRNQGAIIYEPGMTVQQAIALAGGLTDRGSDRRIKADRTMPDGKVAEVSLRLEDKVQANDTIKIANKIF